VDSLSTRIEYLLFLRFSDRPAKEKYEPVDAKEERSCHSLFHSPNGANLVQSGSVGDE